MSSSCTSSRCDVGEAFRMHDLGKFAYRGNLTSDVCLRERDAQLVFSVVDIVSQVFDASKYRTFDVF